MKVSLKELEDNFDEIMNMIEDNTIEKCIIEDENDPTKNVVIIPYSHYEEIKED